MATPILANRIIIIILGSSSSSSGAAAADVVLEAPVADVADAAGVVCVIV